MLTANLQRSKKRLKALSKLKRERRQRGRIPRLLSRLLSRLLRPQSQLSIFRHLPLLLNRLQPQRPLFKKRRRPSSSLLPGTVLYLLCLLMILLRLIWFNVEPRSRKLPKRRQVKSQ